MPRHLLLCLTASALLVGCGTPAPPEIGEVYAYQAPGLNLQGRITALGGCGPLADEEMNDGDNIGVSLQPQVDDPATPCASVLMDMPGQQIAYIVPLDYLQDDGFWKRVP